MLRCDNEEEGGVLSAREVRGYFLVHVVYAVSLCVSWRATCGVYARITAKTPLDCFHAFSIQTVYLVPRIDENPVIKM
jgi:hypothetical protein